MTHNPSRKQFVAKLLGVSAAMSVAPQLLAKTDSTGPFAASKPAASPSRTFELRHDSRAVARRDSL